MAKTYIQSDSFVGRDGKSVEYERLYLQSDTNKDLAIELRLDKTQMTLVKAILASDGVKTVPAPAK
jgi:hypothetical protein